MQLYRKPPSVIGLDIGTSTVKAVKMSRKGKGYLLEKFATEQIEEGVFQGGELKDPSSLAQTMKTVVAKIDRTIKDVVIALPNSAILSDVISIDIVPDKQIREAVMVEAERLSPFDMTEVEIDYQVLERNQELKQMKVLMVAAKHDIIYAYADCLNEAGLRPAVMDVDLFALINIFEINYDIEKYPTSILINIGMETTDALFMQKGMFHSSRDISVTGSHFVKSLESVQGLDGKKIHDILNGTVESDLEVDRIIAALNNTSKEFANAVGVSVSFLQSTETIDKFDAIVLAGGFAHVPGLANVIELRTGAEVIMLDPLQKVIFKEGLLADLGREKAGTLLAVAMGLATRT